MNLLEGILCPIIWVINEDVKGYWPLYQPLLSDWCPAGLDAALHNPLGPVDQLIFIAPHSLLTWSIIQQFAYTYVMGEGAESLAKIMIKVICSPFIH